MDDNYATWAAAAKEKASQVARHMCSYASVRPWGDNGVQHNYPGQSSMSFAKDSWQGKQY